MNTHGTAGIFLPVDPAELPGGLLVAAGAFSTK